MSNTDALMRSGRPRPKRRCSKTRRLFKKHFWTTSGEPVVDGDVRAGVTPSGQSPDRRGRRSLKFGFFRYHVNTREK